MLVLNSLFAQLSRHYWLLTVFITVINLAFSVMCKGYVSSRATRLCQFCVSSFCNSFISKLCFICHVLCTLQQSQQSNLVNQGSRHTFQGCNSVCRFTSGFGCSRKNETQCARFDLIVQMIDSSNTCWFMQQCRARRVVAPNVGDLWSSLLALSHVHTNVAHFHPHVVHDKNVLHVDEFDLFSHVQMHPHKCP